MHILKSNTARLAATAVLTLGVAGAALVTGTASATAAIRPDYSQCVHAGISGTCATVNANVWLLSPDGSKQFVIPKGGAIELTCWYPGSGTGNADEEFDHISWTAAGSASGHVWDIYVDLGGNEASAVVSRC